MHKQLSSLRSFVCGACAAISSGLPAQAVAVVPPIAATLPGNAAVSMPFRWSQGTMQVRIDAALLPPTFVGQTITGLRLRKPSALFEPAYAPRTRTLTVRGGFHPGLAWQASPTLAVNRPASAGVLFGPTAVTTQATPATGVATAHGATMLEIQFATPLPVVAGNLFLEFETTDTSLTVSADDWVDAVWLDNGTEDGYAVQVGAGTCTTRSTRTELSWVGATGPRVGQTANLRLSGAPPTVAGTPQFGYVLAWIGLEPVTRGIAPTYVGYGGDLVALSPGLAGCRQWAPIDASWGGFTDVAGTFAVNVALTGGAATIGRQIGVQAAWLDTSRSGLPLSVSNGVTLVLNSIQVGNRCSTVFFPGTDTVTPWPVEVGLMPVITLLY